MATIINNPADTSRVVEDSGSGVVVGVVIAILIILLAIIFGLPYLRITTGGDITPNNTNIRLEVPNQTAPSNNRTGGNQSPSTPAPSSQY